MEKLLLTIVLCSVLGGVIIHIIDITCASVDTEAPKTIEIGEGSVFINKGNLIEDKTGSKILICDTLYVKTIIKYKQK